ncbi:MAG: DUF4352 domain-containing protein [Spirochaetes bacterium]|nr:DUF4352 domain-containing protein [Spirochaetota bacterium]
MKRFFLISLLILLPLFIFSDEALEKKINENSQNVINWIKSGDIKSLKDFYFNTIDDFYLLDILENTINEQKTLESVQYMLGYQCGLTAGIFSNAVDKLKKSEVDALLQKDADVKRYFDLMYAINKASNIIQNKSLIDVKTFKSIKDEMVYFQTKYPDSYYFLSLALYLDYLNNYVNTPFVISFGNIFKKNNKLYIFITIKNNFQTAKQINIIDEFSIIDGERQFNIDWTSTAMEIDSLNPILLEPGLKTEGWLVFPMPKNQFNYQLVFKGLLSETKLFRDFFDTSNIDEFNDLKIVF